MEGKKIPTTWDNLAFGARTQGASISSLRNILIPHMQAKHGWVGQCLADKMVPRNKVYKSRIVRNLKLGSTEQSTGKKTTKIEMEEGSDDEDDMLLFNMKKVRDIHRSKEEYVNIKMNKLIRMCADQEGLPLEQLLALWKGTPPVQEKREKNEAHLVSPDANEDGDNEASDVESTSTDENLTTATRYYEVFKTKEVELSKAHDEEAQIRADMAKLEAQVRMKDREERVRETRRNEQKKYDKEEDDYNSAFHYLHGSVKGKMDNTLMREWESRSEYKQAIEEVDLLLLLHSLEMVLKRQGAETAFTVSAAKLALMNRKQGEQEGIATYCAAVEVLIDNVYIAGGTLSYPECLATFIKNIDNSRFSEWQNDTVRERIVEQEDMKLEKLLQLFVEWDLQVWRPCQSFKPKTAVTGSSLPDQPVGKSRMIKGKGKRPPGICFAFEKGECTRGDSCRFRHGETGEKKGDNKMCFSFANYGSCKFGDRCRFTHQDLTETKGKVNRVRALPVDSCIREHEMDMKGASGKLCYHINTGVKRSKGYFQGTSDKNVLMHDGGANISVMKDKSVFRDGTFEEFHDREMTTSTAKEGEGMAVRGEGYLKAPLEMIKAYWCPDASANCVAGPHMRANFSCDGKPVDAIEEVFRREGRVVKCVANYEGLLVFENYGKTAGIARAVKKKITLNEKLQEEGHNKPSIQRAKLMGVLHKRLNYASRRKMEGAIDSNRYTDLRLNRADSDLYWDKIHDRTCRGCALGKMKRYPAVERDKPPEEKIGDVAYLDEFHISFKSQKRAHKTYAMCVDGKSGAKCAIYMYNQEERSVEHAVARIQDWYKKKGWTLKKIVWDHLPAHVSIADRLETKLNIKIEFVPPGRHVTEAEVAIRDLKRDFLAVLCGLDHKLERQYYDELVDWCLDTSNMTLNGKNDLLTPWEQLEQLKIRLEYYLGASFGDLVVVPNNSDGGKETRLDTAPTGALAIVVGRDWRTPGNMKVSKLDTGKRVSRMSYAPFEMTDRVKEVLEKGTDPDVEEIKDLKFTWKNIEDKQWGKIDVEDDVEVAYEVWDDTTNEEELPESTREEEDLMANDAPRMDSEGVLYQEHDEVENTGDMTTDSQVESVAPEPPPPEDLNVKKSNRRSRRNKIKEGLTGVNTRSSLKRMGKFMRLTIDTSIKKVGHEETMKAVYKEIKQLLEKGVFVFLDPMEVEERIMNGEILLPSSLFLKEKYDAFDIFEKLKARLVACGNFEELLLKFETESPTVSITTVLMLLEIAARKKMCMKAADIGGAYLNGDSDKGHMMKLGKRLAELIVIMESELAKYKRKDGSIVVELKKCLYGLQEAARVWYDLISKLLIDDGFTRSEWDKCLFFRKDENGEYTYISLYVDDLLIFGKDCIAVDSVIRVLEERFKGEVTVKEGNKISFLGLEISINDDHTKISQSNYVKGILKDLDIVGAAKSPAADDLMDRQPEGVEACDRPKFRRTVMRIMYAGIRTRPDVVYTVGILAGRCESASVTDWGHVVRLLKYLNGTVDDGLVFNVNSEWRLWMSVDASFNHHWDCKGHSGFLIYGSVTGNAAVLIKSFKQKSLADSSTEAELIALHDGVKHLGWISKIYAELGYVSEQKIEIQQDNKACILLSSENPVNFKGRSKFIDRKYFSVYEYVKSGEVELVFTGTDDMISDFLTKALNGSKYRKFKVMIMGVVMNK